MIDTKLFALLTPSNLALALDCEWKFPPHLRYIEKKIMEIFSNGNGRLIVNMPPRHGKSEYISKLLPVWWLLNRPTDRIILTSYSASLAEYFGSENLKKFKELKDIYEMDVSKSQKSKSEFHTSAGGGLISVGTGGSITGKGSNLLIIDDPIKNDTEANSATSRDNLEEWLNATALTRLEPNGSAILVMTRWHEDDLTGRLDSKNWDMVKLPAIAEENDALGRKKGEPLWESRYDKEELLEMKKNIGSFWFSALYQQSPVVESGGIFKREHFKYFTEEGGIISFDKTSQTRQNLNIFATVDLAISTSDSADYTAVLIYGTDKNNNLFILDIIRAKVNPANHKGFIISIFEKYNTLKVGIESVQYQSSLVEILKSEGLPVYSLKPEKDKFRRAIPAATIMENGKVYMNRNMSELDNFESELMHFPNGKHDDMVDCLSYACLSMNKYSKVLPVSLSGIK